MFLKEEIKDYGRSLKNTALKITFSERILEKDPLLHLPHHQAPNKRNTEEKDIILDTITKDGKNIKKFQVRAKKIPNRNAMEKNSEEPRNYQTKWQIS